MRAIVLWTCSLAISGCQAQPEASVGPATLLFGPDESRLDAAAQNAIFTAMGFAVEDTADGPRLVDEYCGPVDPTAEVVDLNQDGRYEVFVAWGNTCTSGHAGRSLALFIQNADGDYRSNLGFPASGYTPLPAAFVGAQAGFPDLEIGGPGFCFPVWRWNGQTYDYLCNRPQAEDGCAMQGHVCGVPQ